MNNINTKLDILKISDKILSTYHKKIIIKKIKKNYIYTRIKNIFKKKLILINFIICLILINITIIIFKLILKINDKKNNTQNNLEQELKYIQEYIYMVMNGTLYNQNQIFYKSENPKISIVISVYNGEAYLKSALLSIQNQDFRDIEIIIVDDFSRDNSVYLIKQLMKKDKRIKLYQNDKNKGSLYTKAKGILHSNAKYVMTLDEDDIYVQKDAFSTLYKESETNNLDILGFASINTKIHLTKDYYIHRYIETPILFRPKIQKRMYDYNNIGKVKRVGDVIYNYFFKTELFIKTIKQIDDKFLNTKMDVHDDFLFFFLLTRNAYNLKQIKRIFYAMIYWPNKNNAQILFRVKEKKKNRENLCCMSYINYIELILIKTNNNILDKKIASFELEEWFLNHKCKNNEFIRKKGIKVCKLFLENEYIENDIKNKIKIFLSQLK